MNHTLILSLALLISVSAGAQNAVHFRQIVQDVLLIPLSHAAGDQNLLDLARLFQLGHFQNVVDGLLTGGGQEAAGVHHHDVRALGGSLDVVSGGLNGRHHLFAVHLVLGTAQGDE